VGCSVYDLTPDTAGMFDVVLCGSLLLHLADPVRALERMREVCRGEVLLVEHIDPYLEVVAPRKAAATFGADWDQWWRVNSAGLRDMVSRAGFEITWIGKRFLVPYGEAAPNYSWRTSALNAISARHPTGRGLAMRALRAKPRPPRPTR
jgi:tRNA (mo5U34)-methyltransferase